MTAVARPRVLPDLGLAARGALLVAGAFALAALSLLRPWALAFDPMAWLLWGRETGRLALETTSGPSWKPFPVLFTTPLALFGPAAPGLWLVLARVGGLFALAGAFVLGERLAGRWAGLAAAATIALSPWWAFNTALGNSEGLLAAAVLWAVIAELAGHRRAALACATAAALMRPEAWPFLAAYGLWLWRADRRAVLVAAVVVPVLWFGPDVVGAGGALGASHNALGADPSPGSAKLASVPALAVLKDAATMLTVPALILALGAALTGPLARRILLGALAWVAIVAAMTLAGYAGNPRYLVVAAALGSVLAGAAAVRGATLLAAPAAPLGAALLVGAVLAVSSGTLRAQSRDVSSRAAAASALDGALARAGGKPALTRCSRIRTSSRARALVAWRLDLPMRDLDARAARPAVVIRAKWFYGQGLEPAVPPGFRPLVSAPDWQIVTACGPAPQQGLLSTDPPVSTG